MYIARRTFRARRGKCCLIFLLAALGLITMFPAGCEPQDTPASPVESTILLSSTAFGNESIIPDRYTCQGDDVSPQLSWIKLPAGTRSLALVMDDLDTSGNKFTHWVIFNIPVDIRELPDALSPQSALPAGVREGKNDFGKIGYGGPCPPPGKPHRYRFTVYSSDIVLDLEAGISKSDLLKAMEGHSLARGQLIGTYQR